MLPPDYFERTYAGVLGKIIGVYLGRPFEGWTYAEIMARLGEITGYVHDRLQVPLVVTDDDISGTFTFLRALPDYGNSPGLTPRQIGQTWLNYLIEGRTVLWWGGLGNSTEHTAYLRLKNGIAAPQSGSIAVNGKVVAEQIGAQIFIDGWAMVAPGDPERAAELAKRAASVSHDGEAVYGAQVLAALEAQAYVEPNLNVLLDTALRFIPKNCVIARLIQDIREWHAEHRQWQDTRAQIEAHYGYDKYGGNCHIVPNHALIIMSLLHSDGDFSRALSLVNTAGWDTDCNSGNVGCILGIRNGLAGISGSVDWRGPVADRMYIPTADGGSTVTDAVQQTVKVVNIGRTLAGLPAISPKRGARFHFELPGAVQGFMPQSGGAASLNLENVEGHSQQGSRSLALHYANVSSANTVSASVLTFIPPETTAMRTYAFIASPTLYPGQTLRCGIRTDSANTQPLQVTLVVKTYNTENGLTVQRGPDVEIAPDEYRELTWTLPRFGGQPIAEVGIELRAERVTTGSVYLDYLTWEGTPDVRFERPAGDGIYWQRAWVDATDHGVNFGPETYRLIQNRGRGLLIQGTRDWRDYTVTATLTPHLANAAGLAARVQGLERYYALLLRQDGTVQLIKKLDGEHLLASGEISWGLGTTYHLQLTVEGRHLRASVDGRVIFDLEDTDRSLEEGAIALVCDEGRVGCEDVEVR